MEELVRKYLCKDSKGRTVKVCEYQEMIDASSAGSPHREYIPGLKRLALESGARVNFVDEKTFQVVVTGERLTVEE